MSDTRCEDCGLYYSHRANCIHWYNTGYSEQIIHLEIKQRVDADLYKAEAKIAELERVIDKAKAIVEKDTSGEYINGIFYSNKMATAIYLEWARWHLEQSKNEGEK